MFNRLIHAYRPVAGRAAALALILAFGCAPTAHAELLDQMVAIVDDDVVLASELEDRISQITEGIQRSGKPLPDAQLLRKEVLDQLIVESIQLQMAQRAGVRISDEQLNEAMGRVAAQNGMKLDQFRQALERDGLSYPAMREQIRKEMTLQRVQQGNVNQRVQISEQEIDHFLDSEEGRQLTAPEYRVLHALIPLPEGASPALETQARQYAERLRAGVNGGKKLEQLIDPASPFKVETSDLGWRSQQDMPSLFTEQVGTLRVGETAEPLRSGSGYHLIKLVDRRGEGEMIAQTRARHILLKPSAIRDAEQTRQQLLELRRQILGGADFAELARKYSEDIGSAQEGGDLNWTSKGQLVPEFQNVMDDSAINAVSEPFASEYGWHILQVTGRRDKDVTDEMRQRIARNFIHKRKFDDELEAWLQKIRDEAYVDIKSGS